jgi:DNA-binding transcriptional regulator YhcF (GntR family)
MEKNLLHINSRSPIPKYRQIIESISVAIEQKSLLLGDRLPSISQLCLDYAVKRDTVMLALSELKSRGIVSSRQGKGYFVSSADVKVEDKVFVLLEELNAVSCSIFNSFMDSMDSNVNADIYFYNHNSHKINELLNSNVGKYTLYVMAAGIHDHFGEIFSKGNHHKLFLLGRCKSAVRNVSCVYEDFENDMYDSLKSVRKSLKKYCRLVYLHSGIREPEGRIDGFMRFCREENIDFSLISDPVELRPTIFEVYFIENDDILVDLMNMISKTDFVVGEDIGLISFGDSALKKIIAGGLTTISADYNEMGSRLADLAKGRKRGQVRIKARVFQRNSL